MRRNAAALAATALAAAVFTAAGAGPAHAALSATQGGGVVTITGDASRNQVGLALIQTATGLEWRVRQICILFCAESVAPGAGCHAGSDGSEGCSASASAARGPWSRLAATTTSFSISSGSAPVTDRIDINGQTGDDTITTGDGPDVVQGGSGDDRLRGEGGSDTVAGSIGNDLLTGGEGNDALDGGDGNDQFDPGLGLDTAEGQAGDDTIHLGTAVKDEKDTVNGGIGLDSVTYSAANLYPGFPNIPAIPGRATAVRIVEANLETLAGAKDFSEGDVLRSIERYTGGLDEDIITGVLSSNISDYFGDSDDDTIFGTSAANTIVGGAGDDQLSAKAGDDIIDAKSGETSTGPHTDFLIDCGDGAADTALMDLKDDLTPTGCELKERSPLGEGPHVRLNVPRRTAVAGGRAAFRLSCPRALKRACAGTLRLQLGRASSPRTAYSIAPGRSRRVPVRLGGLASRVGGRTTAALVSVERGIRGERRPSAPR